MPVNWLATLEATIHKMHTRAKDPATVGKPLFEKDEALGAKMHAILQKFPAHKRVVFLFEKFNRNEVMSPLEKTEIEKFYKLLVR